MSDGNFIGIILGLVLASIGFFRLGTDMGYYQAEQDYKFDPAHFAKVVESKK